VIRKNSVRPKGSSVFAMSRARKPVEASRCMAFLSSTVRAMACKTPRCRWHSRQSWHCRVYKLQILNRRQESESHSLRHLNHVNT